MFRFIAPYLTGNAVQIVLDPPAGAVRWRVLRRQADEFTGPDDAGAIVVLDGTDEFVIDTENLANGTAYVYRAYAWDGNVWIDYGAESVTPAASYRGEGADPQIVVRDRLIAGLAVEVGRGELHPLTGRIDVMTAPFSLAEKTRFPCVSVHLDSANPQTRAIGEILDGSDDSDSQGWLRQTRLNIVGTSQNGDERIALRRAIERILIANLGIFNQAGMVEIDLSQSDSEQLLESAAPLFETRFVLTCQSPLIVRSPASIITRIGVQANT